ncbi:NACHT domain-containing protein [Crocosphaera watsonii WH 8501]|nr:NACHT domain-containing protein [Crocosphaera watsonii]
MKKMKYKNITFLKLFILSLSLFLLLDIHLFSYSQQLSPECQALTNDIQERAKSDAESDRFNLQNLEGSRRNIEDLNNLFGEENKKYNCYTNNKILTIYDLNYESHKFPYFLAIITILLLFIGAVLGRFFEKNLIEPASKKLGKLWEAIYQQFAGSIFLLGTALKRYNKKLIEDHQLLPIIFTGNQLKLPMKDIYVPLKIANSSDRELLNIKSIIQSHRRLMITGEPGSGKTLLCKYLSLNYAEGGFNYLTDKPIPIILELYRVSDSELTIKKLQNAIVKAFERRNFPKADNFVEQQLNNGKLMLLLDGLDEVASKEHSHVVQIIQDFLKKYDQCRVIITCRVAVYQEQFKYNVDQTLTLVDFDDEQIRRFLRAWKESFTPDHSREQLIASLRERPQILQMARNPLILTLIASLYIDSTFVLPHSRLEFYNKVTDRLLELRDMERPYLQQYNNYRLSEKKSILQRLALYAQNNPDKLGKDRKSLSLKNVREEVKKELSSLSRTDNDILPIIDEIVERSGMLQKLDGGENYMFSHLTLQEYFTALAMREEGETLISRFQVDPDSWREIVKLWCGLVNDSTDVIKEIYEKDQLTGFECLADAAKIQPEVEKEILESLKSNLENEASHKAFAVVAADVRPRGEALFSFLTNILNNENEPLSKREAAAKILSKTNLPKAARALGKHYNSLNFISDLLVDMGDVALEELEKWTNQ